MQWNLPVANMLYSGYLTIANTINSDWENHGQIPVFRGQLTADTSYNGHVFPRHFGNLFKTIMEYNDQSIQNTTGMLLNARHLLKNNNKLSFALNINKFKVHYLKIMSLVVSCAAIQGSFIVKLEPLIP